MGEESLLANRHFLVVDDEEFVRKVVTRFLTQSGAEGIIQAADGTAAIDALRSYDMVIDAVVSDYQMTPMNGIDLLRAIRTGAHGLKRNTPVLLLTAYAEGALVSEAMALDVDAFVVKPVGKDALVERVVRVIGRTVPIQPAIFYGGVPEPVAATVPAVEAAASPAASAMSPRRAALLSDEQALHAHNVALAEVVPNSILAKSIYFGEPSKLLLAAPCILTASVLARLNDLQLVHETFPQLYVVEPIS